MESEKTQILKMVEEGKINAEEAAQLLEAVGRRAGEVEKADAGMPRKKKWLKIRVYEGDLEKPKVRVTLPLGLIKMVSKVLPQSARLQLEEKEIDLDQILSQIEDVEGGKIVEVQDDDDNERVEIVVE
ncbi:hypothetical protein JXA40_04155 [bacterium]|nr:hypothetical protein [candidate division CSSED10-310 bacterium]